MGQLCHEELGQVDAASGIAHLVVVPGDALHEIALAVEHLGELAIENRGVRVANDVAADDGIDAILEDALHRALGGSLHGSVDLVGGDVLLELGREVDHRARRRGNAGRETVELAVELGEHETDGLGRARGGGNHGKGRSARATEVLMVHVEDLLVVGVGVNGVHEAALDAEVVVEDLGERREAVGRARGVGDDVHRGRVVDVLVDAHDDGGIHVGARSGDDDLLGAIVEMHLAGLAGLEATRGLDDDLRANGSPVELLGLARLERLDLVALDDERAFLGVAILEDTALAGIVLGKVRRALEITRVVDGDDLYIGIELCETKDQTADATKTIDADFERHSRFTFP